jgi:hypothetical protein
MKKSAFLLLSLSFAAPQAFAALNYDANGPTQESVIAAKDAISRFVLSMKDINGIGVTACESTSGLGFFKFNESEVSSKLFENCIEVYASTEASLAAFRALFPEGSKYGKIFIDSRLSAPATIY